MGRGVDVSEHQSNRGVGWWRQWSWGIIRVHSGYRDDFMWNYHADEAREAGVPIGFYGYLQGDRDPAAQAERMVNISSVYAPELGWWSDVEDPTVDWDNARRHTEKLREMVPGRHGVYSNCGDYLAFVQGWGDDLPWWMADYGPNDGTQHDPFEQPPVPHRDYQIHQFTSVGGPAGAGLDVNDCADLPGLIVRMGGAQPPVPPSPSPAPLPEEVPAMGAVEHFMYPVGSAGAAVLNAVWIDGRGNIHHSWSDPGPTWDHTEILSGPDAVASPGLPPVPVKAPAVPELGISAQLYGDPVVRTVSVAAISRAGSFIALRFEPGVGWVDYSLVGAPPPAGLTAVDLDRLAGNVSAGIVKSGGINRDRHAGVGAEIVKAAGV